MVTLYPEREGCTCPVYLGINEREGEHMSLIVRQVLAGSRRQRHLVDRSIFHYVSIYCRVALCPIVNASAES